MYIYISPCMYVCMYVCMHAAITNTHDIYIYISMLLNSRHVRTQRLPSAETPKRVPFLHDLKINI